MQHRRSWFLGIVIVLLLFFVVAMPSIGTRVSRFFGPQALTPNDTAQLAAENESLKAKLAELSVIQNQLPTVPQNAIRAMVDSTYPMNFKNEVMVNVGSDNQIASGDTVLFQGTLFGLIEKVWPTSALVQTIFDPQFKTHVRIGPSGYDGLFLGGPYPTVETIAKSAKLMQGDVVYTAGSGMPYATPIAEIAQVTAAPSDLFKEASLSFPYDMSMIQTVEIIK